MSPISAAGQPRFLLRAILGALDRAREQVQQALDDLDDPHYVLDLGDRDLPVQLQGKRYRVNGWRHVPDDPYVYLTLRPEGEE